jgi:predicted nuclease with RNAse H fold
MQRVVGIDFGARKAGTTVVAWNEGATIRFAQSKEGKDSDLFLRDVVADLSPDLIAIDAPLTLPGVYRDVVGCSDFHLRECDRALKAMSPMFLGGLTARAMALAAAWRAEGITVYETYPRQVAMRLGMDTSEIDADWIQALFRHHGFAVVLPGSKVSKHLLDASLCALPWVCGLGMQAVGKKAEGVIYLPSSPKKQSFRGI